MGRKKQNVSFGVPCMDWVYRRQGIGKKKERERGKKTKQIVEGQEYAEKFSSKWKPKINAFWIRRIDREWACRWTEIDNERERKKERTKERKKERRERERGRDART